MKTRRKRQQGPAGKQATGGRARRSSAANLKEQFDQQTREHDEALEREKATAEVLRVISSSPCELERVSQAMLENAVRLCAASFRNLPSQNPLPTAATESRP
jgi:hypothetical protein